MKTNCYKCNETLEFHPESEIPRSEECPKCSASLRVCRMCTFYDPRSYNECRETIAERIVDKEKANFCDFFKLSLNVFTQENKKDDLLAAANALFKKG